MLLARPAFNFQQQDCGCSRAMASQVHLSMLSLSRPQLVLHCGLYAPLKQMMT